MASIESAESARPGVPASDSSAATAALLSLWNGVDESRVDEYERWHTLEHVPERVWVPGFRSGTRYVTARADQVRYFTLYELDELDCLSSAAYQDLVDNPTPWSASMRPAFRGFLRKTGPVIAQAGNTLGSAIVVSRMVWTGGETSGASASHSDAQAWTAYAQQLLSSGAANVATRVRVQASVAAGPQAMRNDDSAPLGTEFISLAETAGTGAVEEMPARVDAALKYAGFRLPDWREDTVFALVSQVRHEHVATGARPGA